MAPCSITDPFPTNTAFPTKGLPSTSPFDAWLETKLKIGRNFRQGLPNILDVLENDFVLGTAQVQKLIRRKHACDVSSPSALREYG